jgi:hypothetical protein
MEHVSLCIDNFMCAKAYQKERDLRRMPYGKIGKHCVTALLTYVTLILRVVADVHLFM